MLGGMGPLATLDFSTNCSTPRPRSSDQQQIPHVVWNVPQIADRQKALAGTGPSPLPQLLTVWKS
jgi:aspartate racemase